MFNNNFNFNINFLLRTLRKLKVLEQLFWFLNSFDNTDLLFVKTVSTHFKQIICKTIYFKI